MTQNTPRPPGDDDDEDARAEPPTDAPPPLTPWNPAAEREQTAEPGAPTEPPTFTELISRPPGAGDPEPAPRSPLLDPVLPPPALQPPPALIPPPQPPAVPGVEEIPTEAMPRIEELPTEAMPAVSDSADPAPTEALAVSELPVSERPGSERPGDAATELLRAPSPPGVGDAPIDGDVDGDALEAIFGEENFREYEPSPLLASSSAPPAVTVDAARPAAAAPFGGVSPAGAPAQSGAGPAAGDARRASGLDRTQRTLLWVAGALAAVLALIALFFLGTRIPEWTAAEPEPTPTVEPTPEPEPEPEPDPLEGVPDGVPLPAGDWEWSLLRGGECIEPWVSPWEEQFTVVDCATPHAAQLILREAIADAPEEFPGTEAIASPLSLICSSPQVLDYTLAAAYDDVQIQTAYPVTAEEWDEGYRDFFCFISRASGGPLEGDLSLAGTAE